MMYAKKKESKLKNVLKSQISISMIGLVVIILISIPLAKNLSKQYKINSEINLLQDEISQLEGKNQNLKNLISFLESDQYIDEEARKNLNFKKQGEEVVVIKDGKEVTEAAGEELSSKYMINQPRPAKQEVLSNPDKWLSYFFSKN